MDGAVDDGVVLQLERTGVRAQAQEAVAGTLVGVGAVGQGRVQQQFLLDQRLVGAHGGLDQEYELAIAVQRVGQTAIDLHAHAIWRRGDGRFGLARVGQELGGGAGTHVGW